jgi:hypothetical protein
MAVAAIMAAGAAITALGQMQEGADAEVAAKFKARQEIRNAKASKAEGIRGSIEANRQGDIAVSDASAAMVGAGGVTDDVGAIKTLSKIKQKTDYNALVSIYKGDQRAQTQTLQAEMDRTAGRAKNRAAQYRAAGTALKGASSAYSMGSA